MSYKHDNSGGELYENKGQELDALGYDQIDKPCPLCGCFVMESPPHSFEWSVEERMQICPCCEWWDISYDA